ncbi:MAG: uridylate kinase [Patescibacteria group bacterium]|nr:UMP kinase [Candidatus Saccharibacteria bacterium]MDQ5963188.1 uridylate kinase [Patescibacteria group bacterium]
MYKRILLKLSGEQLQGEQSGGFDTERATWVAGQVRTALASGTQIIIMVGGGNYARGAQLANDAIQRITGDYVGMLATMMNALALADVFNHADVPTRALTNVKADQVLDQFTHRRAMSHLEKNRVVIVAGGTGRPFLTTDTAAVNLALELDCDAIIKTTKVDGVYDKDPAMFSDATKYENLSYQEALSNPDIAVMDKAALGLVLETRTPLIVCDLLTDGNISRAANGEAVGTTIS